MKDKNWTNLHAIYSKEDWINKPSIFANESIEYFPKYGRILEIGAGHGQDGFYFASQGFNVVCTDLEIISLDKNISGADAKIQEKVEIEQLDLRKPFHFEEKFDVIYAHLSLHYFDQATTKRIFEDIYNTLKPNGILAFFTNSVDDPEYGAGTKIEEHYFEIEGVAKRYFDVKAAKTFAHQFIPLLADNNGETYKDAAKDVHHLIRFIGQKVEA
jgi:SAM-dependent methyltransferase